jgi:hypothetical protein
MRIFAKLAMLTVLVLLPAGLHADTLTGQSFTLYHLYPNTSTIYSSLTFTAPNEIIELSWNPHIVIQLSGDSIHIGFQNASYSSAAFNGERISFPGFNFSNVTMSTDLSGVILTFDAHDIFVNWQGLSTRSGDYVDLTENSPSPTPEPGTMLMFGTGVLGLMGAVRRRFSL